MKKEVKKMPRKDSYEDEDYEEVQQPKRVTNNQPEPRVEVITENQLLNYKLDQIISLLEKPQ